MPADPDPLMVDERTAGRMLSLCAKTVANLRRRGELRYVTVGRSIRYRIDELRRFISESESKPLASEGERRCG